MTMLTVSMTKMSVNDTAIEASKGGMTANGQYDILAGIDPHVVFAIELIGIMLLVIVAGCIFDLMIEDYRKNKDRRR
jgi:hypothetical protein